MSGSTLAKTNIKIGIFSLFAFASAVVCILMLLASALQYVPSYYSLLPLLPLSCTVGYAILSTSGQRSRSVSCMIISVMAFVRYCLLPLVMIAGNFASLMKLNIALTGNNGILLMAYEALAIFITVALFCKRYDKNAARAAEKAKAKESNISLGMFDGVMVFMILFIVAVAIMIPEVMNGFQTIFDMAESDFTTVHYSAAQTQVGTIKRALQTLFSMVFHFVRIMLPLWIIFKMKKNRWSDLIICIISVLFSAVQFVFITSTFAESIISAFVILMMTAYLCPKNRKAMAISIVFMLITIVASFFIVRYSVRTTTNSLYNVNGIKYVSSIANAYLGGIDNVAAIFNVDDTSKWESLFFNLYSAIPFNTTLFGLEGDKLQELYNNANASYGQITPTVASGYYYFGPVFAPVFSVLLTMISLKFDTVADLTDSFWKKTAYKFCMLSFSLGISMYGEAIVLAWFTTWGLPLILLSLFSRKKYSIKAVVYEQD